MIFKPTRHKKMITDSLILYTLSYRISAKYLKKLGRQKEKGARRLPLNGKHGSISFS